MFEQTTINLIFSLEILHLYRVKTFLNGHLEFTTNVYRGKSSSCPV